MWSNIRYLIGIEYKRLRFAYVFCLLFTLLYGWLTAQIALGVDHRGTDSTRLELAWSVIPQDIFFLLVVPTVSFLLQRKMFGVYWKTDMYSQNLQYMKRFPIHAREIVYSRLIRHAINTVVLLAIFFTAYTLGYNAMSDQDLSVATAVSFGCIWLSYALVAGAMFVYWEMMMNGKQYFRLTLLTMVITPLFMIPFYLGTGYSIVHLTLDLARSRLQFVWSGLLLMLAAVLTMIAGVVLANKLQKRDFC
ncbi:hypothetical protein DUZ99_03015 [Xylanibacillus composti]|uniref:Uncharacterized protein n=1 Tax=Xylanibacillus composti TaxID=1572762 RepID=A0A8J4M193_9BACL|nr:hypothetical protein [Xylanibacillus composti]MDT9723969.1 hypothetical protein [Xylanibacillus composti]GIQ67850.1 hypothetical protein XYCOK13_06740 [Xylanibacillus composti]